MNDISNATLLAIVSLLSYIVLAKLFELSRYCNKVTSEGVHNPHEYYVSCIMPIPLLNNSFQTMIYDIHIPPVQVTILLAG